MHKYLESKGVNDKVLRHGGERVVGGVKFHVVTGHHSNGVPRNLLTDAGTSGNWDLADDGLSAYVGPENGYVIEFTNGLVVYLSGDTGPTSDMKHIVRNFYKADVAVLHLGSPFSMTPTAGAFAACELIRPKTVIPEHVRSANSPGNLAANVQSFIGQVCPGGKGQQIDVIVPFSFGTNDDDFVISCNGNGKCTQALP